MNALSFWLAALFAPGFSVQGRLALILTPVILSFVNNALDSYFAEKY
jgi:putative membrane protein